MTILFLLVLLIAWDLLIRDSMAPSNILATLKKIFMLNLKNILKMYVKLKNALYFEVMKYAVMFLSR